MKSTIAIACALLFSLGANATNGVLSADSTKSAKDTTEGFKFTTIKANPITSIKNQNRSGTCWCYSGLGFLEAELLKAGKGTHDISEAYIVNKTYADRAEKAVRMHGDVSFTEGGSFYDVLYCWRNYGVIPEEAMPSMGTVYGDTLPNSQEMMSVAGAYVNAISKGDLKKLSPVWKNGLTGLLDSYLGKCPTDFIYKGKKYTPESYAQSLGLNMDDYVSITSYTHHPFWQPFVLEIQDNWRWASSYNVPIDDMMRIIDNAVADGYTIAWGADVSETGFSRNGVASVPDEKKAAEATGTDMARWTGLSAAEKKNKISEKPMPELTITQDMRQKAYDNWETTDDHGMVIYGTAKDQNGKEYYMVKNSWGDYGKYKGIFYATKAYVAYKTMNFIVNKHALPKDIAKKLGIKL
jgi:aminopeptidase C